MVLWGSLRKLKVGSLILKTSEETGTGGCLAFRFSKNQNHWLLKKSKNCWAPVQIVWSAWGVFVWCQIHISSIGLWSLSTKEMCKYEMFGAKYNYNPRSMALQPVNQGCPEPKVSGEIHLPTIQARGPAVLAHLV